MKLDRRTCSAGKSRRLQRRRAAARMGWPLALAVGFSAPGLAQTLPQGGNVVGGAGTITQTAPNQLTINQASQNLAIDWQSFSIGANNIVRFVQPSTSAVALNRVLNGDPSQIYGQIQANGQVVIMSPNGIVFGPNSRIDVNALVATTANISTLDFMAGKLLFDQASSDANARVVNQGIISVAQGGFAVLAAANVSNQGQIIANGGTVVLGGTKTFAIDFHGDGLLKFAATGVVDQKPTGADALVENSGSIEANGGRVLLTARAARSVLDNVINTTGIVVARTASLVNGEIVIDGGDSGIVHVAGTLDASGAAAGESGGTVKVLGEKVGLFENARIDASGTAGGGTVLVGGNYQGMGPEANAQYLYMDARAVIDASSASGDGGRVILWSDIATRNAGHINVAGARNGGFIEVSSKGFLDFRGTVDLRGLSGRAGELLLDPTDITISSSASDPDMSGASPFQGSNASSNLDVAILNSVLAGGATVTVTTASAGAGTGNITITDTIASGAGGATLILRADNDIIASGTSALGGGTYLLNLSLRAGGNISISSATVNLAGGSLTTTGITGTGSAGGSFTLASGTFQAANMTLNQAGAISLDAVGAALSGTLTLNATGATTQTEAIAATGGLVVGGTGAVTLAFGANNFGSLTFNRMGTSSNVSIGANFGARTVQTSTLGVGTFALTSTAGFTQAGGITQDGGGGAVSISGGAGTVALSQANTWTGALTVTGQTIDVTGSQTATGTGSITLDATQSVSIGGNLTTATGDILVKANVASWANLATGTPTFSSAAGDFKGVHILPSVLVSTTDGNIYIAGKGGTSASNNGVLVDQGDINAGGTGSVRIFGAGTATSAHGVEVFNGGVIAGGALDIVGDDGAGGDATWFGIALNTATVTAGGNIFLTGRGGYNGSGTGYYQLNGSAVSSTGGTVSIVGETASATSVGVNLAGGSVQVSGGVGGILISSPKNVSISTNLSTAGGDILVKANVATWTDPFDPMDTPTFGTTSGSFDGVVVNSGVSINANGGDIAIAGKGGNTGANQHGVRMYAAAATPTTIATTGTGTITLYGQGGLSSGNAGGGLGGSHGGFRFDGNATGVIDISTQHGDIKMVGAGGGTGVSSDNNGGGVFFYTKVRATGTGSIDIAGTPGVGASVGLAAIFAQTEISTVSGNIALTGTGGTAYVNDGSFSGAQGAKGLWISGATVRTTGSGGITLRGIDGTDGPAILISDVTYGAVTLGNAAMTGDLTIQTNSLTYVGTNTIAHQAGSGILTFRTDTAPTNLVFYGSGGGLQLTSAIVNAFSGNFGTLAVGDASQTGTITTGAAYTAPSGQSLSLTTGGNLTVNYALATAGAGALSLTSAKAIALLGNVTTGGGDIVMKGGNVGAWTGPFTNASPTYGTATGTFVGVAIGAAIQVTAGAGGNIAIAGRGGDTGGSQYGIQMYSGATVSTSGTGAIIMVGRGGGNGDGMAIDGATVSSTGSGAIQMVGIPGTTTGGGFAFSGAVTLGNAAYTGNLTLRSDGAIAGTASVALPHQAGTGNFTVRTHTDATPIFAATAGAGLEFASDLLSAASSYGGIVVGSPTQSGTITMGAHTLANQFTVVGGTAAISIAGAVALGTYTLSLESGGTVTQSAAITGTSGILALGGTGSGAVTLTNGGNSFGLLSLGRTNNTGNVTVSTTADLEIIGDWSTAAMDVTANSIMTNGALNATGGSLEMNAIQFINLQHNISTNGGNILLLGNANWATAPTGNPTFNSATGNFSGVSVTGISVDAGAGGIYIAGAGGTNASGLQHGVTITGGGTVVSSGEIKIYGQGGTSTGSYNSGLTIDGGTIAAGAGGLTIVATGGAGAGTLNLGLYATSSASITGTGGGVMSITATGGTSSGAGLSFNGASITATGATTLALSGASSTTYGIEGFSTASTISTASGALTMNATGDVYLPATAITTASAPLSVTTTGNVNLSNASNSIGGNTTINATGSTSNVNFRNTAATHNLNVTSAGDLGLFDLTVTGNLTASAAGVLTVNTPVTMAGGNATLTATGAAADIQIQGDVTLSSGFFTATSARSIAVTANIATSGGAIDIYANAPGGNVNTGTATGVFHGVRIDGAITVNAGGGNIDIRGRAGDSGSNHGVTIRNGAGVLTSGTGTLNIMGHGGTSTAGGSAGVEFYDLGAYAQTQNGALTVNGYGSTGGGGGNIGVALATGEIRATGTGTVNVSGAGGAGGSFGVSVQGGGTTLISTVNGNLTVIGNGGLGSGGGFESWGVNVAGQSGQGSIESTGTGNISVTGTAGATSGNDRYGVIVGSGGSIVATSAGGGTLSVTGTGGPGTGTNNHGIYLTGAGATISGTGFSVVLTGTGGTGATSGDGIRFDSGADTHSDDGQLTMTGVGTGSGFGIAATGTGSTIGDPASAGNINIIADTVSMSAATLGIETDGQVLIRPVNSGTTIGIGGGAGTQQLPSDMSFVDAALLVVGDPVAGAIAVGAGGVSTATGTDLGLRGASIALTGDVTLGAVRTLTLYANTDGVTQAAGSTVTAANLVLRGAGDFAVNRAGSGYNNITNVAADVTAGSGSGAIVLYTGAGGGSSSNALTDGVGTVNGISTPGGLTWVALNGLTQTAAGVISVGGVTNLTAQNGTLDMSAAPNTFSGQVGATSAGGGSILLTASTLALGSINSAGNVILNATSGGITHGSPVTANGNLNAAANGGAIVLSNHLNVVAGSVSLATSGGAHDISWDQLGPMLVGSISSSGQLDINITNGGISQVGAISTGGATNLIVDTGNIALTNAANAFVGPIVASNPSGDISIANTGNTLFGNIASNGVLNVSVTGGTLSQTSGSSISTSGNATVTLAGAYALTLTESGNNVGGNLTLSGSTGTLNGTLNSPVAVTAGSFVVNGLTYTAAAPPPPPSNSTAPAPGAGAGGTTISSALTNAAPVSQIQAAANLSPPPPGATAVVSDTVALLTGGPGPLVGGGSAGPATAGGTAGPAEGEGGGPAVSPAGVVIAPPSAPASAGPGATSPAAAQTTPAIVTTAGSPPAGTALVSVTPSNPAVSATGIVGGATTRAENGGAVQPTTSAPQTAVTSPFPSMSF
jgi:filamentous hemagglutinin family protein